MNNFLKKFFDRLDAVRADRTVTEFARDCGINQPTMFNYHRRTRVPSIETLAQICITNMISADWLLGFTDERTGTAAPVADTALTEKIKELERLLDMLKAENQGLKYALDAFKR
jgi:transcriptional regulator with XRE-family HTH domain